MNSPESHIAELKAEVGGLQKLIEQQRAEGRERGNKIEEMKQELASQNTRISEMEHHVRHECLWGNGEITNIKVNMAQLSLKYENIDNGVKEVKSNTDKLTLAIGKMRVQIIWIIAGSVIGGGAASGASEFLLKFLGS